MQTRQAMCLTPRDVFLHERCRVACSRWHCGSAICTIRLLCLGKPAVLLLFPFMSKSRTLEGGCPGFPKLPLTAFLDGALLKGRVLIPPCPVRNDVMSLCLDLFTVEVACLDYCCFLKSRIIVTLLHLTHSSSRHQTVSILQ